MCAVDIAEVLSDCCRSTGVMKGSKHCVDSCDDGRMVIEQQHKCGKESERPAPSGAQQPCVFETVALQIGHPTMLQMTSRHSLMTCRHLWAPQTSMPASFICKGCMPAPGPHCTAASMTAEGAKFSFCLCDCQYHMVGLPVRASELLGSATFTSFCFFE